MERNIISRAVANHFSARKHLKRPSATMEVTNTARSSIPQKCTSCEGPEVSGWCVECGEALCKECVSAHKRVKMTRSHTIRTQPASGGFPLSSTGFCQIHKHEPIKLFCFTCSQLTCRDCQLMDHRNHSFQFIHEAMDTQRKSVDSLVQHVQTHREEVRQSLLDLDGRLEDIEQHKSKLRKSLGNALVIFAQRFKQRMLTLYLDVTRVYQSEVDGIEKRKAELRRLEERQKYVAEFTEKAMNVDHFPTLLAYKTQIESQLKEILSQETKPAESMIKLSLLARQSTYHQLLSFGEVSVSTVPFSRSQPHLDKSSSAVPVKHREGPGAAVVHTSSSGPQNSITSAPPASHLPPQTGDRSDADPLNPVNKSSTSQQVLPNQFCLPLPLQPNVCQSNANETLPTPLYLTPISQSPPISNPVQTSLVPIRDSQLNSVPANHTQPNSSLGNHSTQASVPSNYTQSSMTTANPSQAYAVTQKLQSSLVRKLNSIPATTTTNHSQSSTVTVTNAQFPMSEVYYALPPSALLSHSQSSTFPENCYLTPTGIVTLDQHSTYQVNYSQLTRVAANHSESSSVTVNQCSKTNHWQFSTVPVQHGQPSWVQGYQMIHLNHTQPNKSTLLNQYQSSPVFINQGQSSPAVVNQGQSSPAVVNQGQSSPAVVNQGQSSPAVVNQGQSSPAVVNHSQSSPAVLNQGQSSPAVLNQGQSSPAVLNQGQSSPAILNQGQSSPAVISQGQSSPAVLNQGQSSPAVLNQGQSSPAVLNQGQSSPAVLNQGQSSPAVLNQGQSSPAVISQGHSSSAVIGQGQANGAPESLEKHSMVPANQDQPCTNPLNQTQSHTDSPSLTAKPQITVDNHPLLLYLLKSSTSSPSNKSPKENSEEKDGISTVIPPDNPDHSTADTDQLLTSDSIVQSRVLNQTVFFTQYQHPTRTVKAVADSACDSSTPLVSDLTAVSQHQAGENEPTSTVTDIETTELVYCTLPSEFLLACDDINAYITLDSESDSEDTSTKKLALSPVLSMGEVTLTDPESQSSSRSVKCETDLMGFDDIVSISSQSQWSSTHPHLAKDGHSIDRSKEKRDSASHERRPIKLAFRRKSRGSRSIWKVGMRSKRRFQETKPLEKPSTSSLVCKLPYSIELSSIDGYKVYNSRKWQPRVSLFQLPISNPTPGRPLPQFLLVPGDGKDEIHLQEIDEDNQSHADDLMNFLEPLSSPESPPLLHFVLCAACGSLKASIICVVCGRGYHRDCHIPAIGPSVWQEWNCSLCQDLSDPRDPYCDERGKMPCLSLLDQRKCEHLLLYLMCENSSNILHHTDEPSCGSAYLQLIRERLSHQRSPPYRSPSEFVSDVWVQLETWSTSTEYNEAHTKLQGRFQNKLRATFGTELHPSLLTQPNASPTNPTKRGEGAVADWSKVLMHLNPCLTEEVKEAGSEQGTEASKTLMCSNNKVTEEAKDMGSEGSTTETDANTSHTEKDKEARAERSKPSCSSHSDSDTNLTEEVPEAWKSPTPPYTSQTEQGKLPKLRETRKRLREFLGLSRSPKKLKTEKDQDDKREQDDDDGLDKIN